MKCVINSGMVGAWPSGAGGPLSSTSCSVTSSFHTHFYHAHVNSFHTFCCAAAAGANKRCQNSVMMGGFSSRRGSCQHGLRQLQPFVSFCSLSSNTSNIACHRFNRRFERSLRLREKNTLPHLGELHGVLDGVLQHSQAGPLLLPCPCS